MVTISSFFTKKNLKLSILTLCVIILIKLIYNYRIQSDFVIGDNNFIKDPTDAIKSIFQPQTLAVLKEAIQTWEDDTEDTQDAKLAALINNTRYKLEDWDVSKITDFSGAFRDSPKLTNQNLSSWFSNINHTNLNLSEMFKNCKIFTGNGLEKLDFSNVTENLNMERMFYGCEAFTGENLQLTLPETVTENLDMFYMFYGCEAFTGENLTSFYVGNVGGNLDMAYMFLDCLAFTGENLTSLNVGNVGGSLIMIQMFSSCKSRRAK